MKKGATIFLSVFLTVAVFFIVFMFNDDEMVMSMGTSTSTELTGKTAAEITADMGYGWNLGNSFDATGGNSSNIYSQETSWGNPQVTETLIKAVSDAGFTTIRIPVTWYRHISDDGSYTIDEDWLERIKTVVDYAYKYDMYVIINVHHESWVNTSALSTDYVEIGEELSAVWSQIADYFADYDQHLIFEGMNEPRLVGEDNEWTGDSDAYTAVNYLNQIFVSAVRSSGEGHNDERCLMIPGYAASNDYSILSALSIPTYNGEACNNLIISVHAYSPYNFCLSDSQTTFSASNSSDTEAIDTVFETIDELFLSQGIPVVIGETGATNSGGNTSAREAWAAYMGKMAAGYGVPIILWDNGSNKTSGGECHAYFDRSTGEQLYPTIISAFLDAKDDITWGSLRSANDGSTNSSVSLMGGTIIWSNTDGLTADKTYDSTYISMSAEPQWFTSGRQIAILYTGSSTPQLILDSAEVEAWWIPVSASSTSTLDGKNVAYFDFEDIEAAYKSYGVTDPSQLRNLCVIATGSNTTTYEISVTGDYVATFMVYGEVYAQQTTLPEDPTMTNMVFAGWYTTKNYESGTEYTGGNLTSDITLYAKFTLATDPTGTDDTLDPADCEKGDINLDGYIDYLDAMVALRYDAELVTLSADQITLGDVNSDGAVDSLDAILILRYDAGLVDSFD